MIVTIGPPKRLCWKYGVTFGFPITIKCQKCGLVFEDTTSEEDTVRYPEPGQWKTSFEYVCCPNCDYDMELEFKFRYLVEVVV